MKILCPTDYSDHSRLALEYAMNICNMLDAELHIISVFQVSKSTGSFVSIEDIMRRNHEQVMDQLITNLSTKLSYDKKPITKVMKGRTVSSILKYANHYHIDLIIMGTQGGNSLRTLLFGSITKKLATKTTIPILAIPETVKHTLTSNKMLLALDDKVLENERMFNIPLRLSKKIGMKIDILHVETKEEMIPFDPFVSSYLGDCMGEVTIEKGTNAVDAIKTYVEQNNIGILMMIRREKSFFEKLLTVGDTSAELAETNIPLLILPESLHSSGKTSSQVNDDQYHHYS